MGKEMLYPDGLELTHYPSMSKSNVQRLYSEIKSDGLIKAPIRYVKYNGRRFILDGTHRTLIAQKLGLQIPAIEVQLPYGNFRTVNDLFGETIKVPGFWRYLK